MSIVNHILKDTHIEIKEGVFLPVAGIGPVEHGPVGTLVDSEKDGPRVGSYYSDLAKWKAGKEPVRVAYRCRVFTNIEDFFSNKFYDLFDLEAETFLHRIGLPLVRLDLLEKYKPESQPAPINLAEMVIGSARSKPLENPAYPEADLMTTVRRLNLQNRNSEPKTTEQ